MGHASMRTNGGGTPIRAEEPTIASMLKSRGYATGGFGKWGIGGRGSEGVPENPSNGPPNSWAATFVRTVLHPEMNPSRSVLLAAPPAQ